MYKSCVVVTMSNAECQKFQIPQMLRLKISLFLVHNVPMLLFDFSVFFFSFFLFPGHPVKMVKKCVGIEASEVCDDPRYSIVLLENARFHIEEEGKGTSRISHFAFRVSRFVFRVLNWQLTLRDAWLLANQRVGHEEAEDGQS